VVLTVILGSSKLARLGEAVFKEKATRQKPANTMVSVANGTLGILGKLPLYLAFPQPRALWK
jgi:hypothetical protein